MAEFDDRLLELVAETVARPTFAAERVNTALEVDPSIFEVIEKSKPYPVVEPIPLSNEAMLGKVAVTLLKMRYYLGGQRYGVVVVGVGDGFHTALRTADKLGCAVDYAYRTFSGKSREFLFSGAGQPAFLRHSEAPDLDRGFDSDDDAGFASTGTARPRVEWITI